MSGSAMKRVLLFVALGISVEAQEGIGQSHARELAGNPAGLRMELSFAADRSTFQLGEAIPMKRHGGLRRIRWAGVRKPASRRH
jgi:hypothetical protein